MMFRALLIQVVLFDAIFYIYYKLLTTLVIKIIIIKKYDQFTKTRGSIWSGNWGQFTPESRGSITTEEVGSVCSESPVAYKTAEIQVRNSNGKIIETLEVTNDFEFIYLPAE